MIHSLVVTQYMHFCPPNPKELDRIVSHVGIPRRVRDEIEPNTFRIGFAQVDGRMNDLVAQR